MIEFCDVSKYYRIPGGRRIVLEDASFSFEIGHNYGILGGNGAGKSTLLRLISGSEPPNRGRVVRRARVSFPLGFTGTFHGHLSGRQNCTFLARVYGADEHVVDRFVADFSELGRYLDMPVQTYSSGMAAKLAFGLSLALDFDVYLVDEVTEVGDARFRQKCAEAFRDRAKRSDVVMVSHNSHTVKAYCDRGAVIGDGRIEFFDTVEEAMRVQSSRMGSLDA